MATLHSKALTFDDVLIRPGESDIEPREANLSSEVIIMIESKPHSIVL